METPSDPIHIRVLVLDDLGIKVAGKIDSALKQLKAEEETETSWTFSFGHLGQASLECEFIDDPNQALTLLQKVREAGADSEYDIVLVDNDWTEIPGGYATTHGLKMIKSIGFPRSFTGALIAMYTTSPDFEASFVAQALGAGAQFFVHKSEHVHLLNLIFLAIDRQHLRKKELLELKLVKESIVKFDPQLKTNSSRMQECLRSAAHYAALTDFNILIIGESGTGKSRLARAIHGISRRSSGPLEEIDLGQIHPDRHEVVLFGQEGDEGNSSQFRPGLLELAAGGTLIIKAIDRLSKATQLLLLPVLATDKESYYYRRVGGTQQLKPNVRIICTMSKKKIGDLKNEAFEKGVSDGGIIEVPSLAERPEDVHLLAEHFLESHNNNARKGLAPLEFSEEALQALASHKWLGNIRELRATVVRSAAHLTESTTITPNALSFSNVVHQENLAEEWGPESMIAALRCAPRRNTSQRKIFDLLLNQAPNLVSQGELLKALEYEALTEQNSFVLMNVISRLRNRLKEGGLDIQRDEGGMNYRLIQDIVRSI